jgi:asparagine synthetase B (glutamine-hydrolysing)
MFLLCVTPRPLALRPGPGVVRETRIGPWTITVAVDGWLSHSEADGEHVWVDEVPPFAREPAGRDGLPLRQSPLTLSAARFTARERAIEIERPLLGGRQVYYHASADGSFFCSTHIGLLRSAGVTLDEDVRRLAELMVYRYVAPPRTLFRGIDQVLAGQRLRFEFDGRTWRGAADDRYSPPAAPKAGPTATGSAVADYSERTHDELRKAILLLGPDRDRVHVLLSGGLDSSILFKLAHTELGVSDSHSTGYPFEDSDRNIEKRYALTAAEALGARHQYYTPGLREFLRGTVEVVAAAEQPMIFTQSVLLLLLFRDALPAEQGTVVVGQGADGLYGVRLHRAVGNIERFKTAHPWLSPAVHPRLWSALRPLTSRPAVAARAQSLLNRLVYDDRAFEILSRSTWGRGVDLADPRHVLWRLGVTGDWDWARRRFDVPATEIFATRAAALAAYRDRGVLDALSLLDFLSDVSMSQSIWSKLGESARKVVYYPFNARGLMDSAFAIPWHAKLVEPKAILRNVARRIGVPPFIVNRPKANFNIATRGWAAPGGVFEPLVPIAASVWGADEVRRAQTEAGPHTFWTMVNYAIWKRLFLGGESVTELMAELDQDLARSAARQAS